MKKLYAFIVLLVIALVVPNKVSAQSKTDTVYIPGSKSLQISDIINADTSVTASRVYVLDRGAIYYIDKAFEITHSCKFISTGTSTKRPAVLAAAIRADNSSEEWYFKLIQVGIKVELDDLYLLSMRSDLKTLGWSRAIHIGADNISLKLRRVVFDGWSDSGIRVFGADNVKLDVQDCHFRNFMHSTSYFGGQPFLSEDTDHPDTTIFINNTFFACNAYVFSVRGHGPKSVFEHNTVVYTTVNPFETAKADNIYIKNNLFYAVHAWGGNPEQIIGGWFENAYDTISSCVLAINKKMTYNGKEITGPEFYYQDLNLTYDPSKRLEAVHNNVCYNPDKLVKFYKDWNDTVKTYDSVEVLHGPKQYLKRVLTMAPWLNKLDKIVIDSLTNPKSWDYSSYISIDDAINANPGFSDAGTVGHIDSLISYVQQIATGKFYNGWQYKMTFPPTWPLPENLAYTNTSLLNGGTDGFAIGDLNWFPAQKATWTITDVKTLSSNVPEKFNLSQNYPNPFNPDTKINFSIPKSGNVKIEIFNILGQKVRTLLDQEFNAGSYSSTWNGRNDFGKQLSSGTYFYSIETGSFRMTKKMILMK